MMQSRNEKGVCYHCQERTMTCHSTCERYIAECKKVQETNAALEKERMLTEYKRRQYNRYRPKKKGKLS